MNWGFKIAGLYASFVIFMIWMTWKSCGEKIELVTDNYYEEELRYQDVISRESNFNKLGEKITADTEGDWITLSVPGELPDSVSIRFLRPSDSRLDRNVTLSPGPEGDVRVMKHLFEKGLYRATLRWMKNNEEYQATVPVLIN